MTKTHTMRSRLISLVLVLVMVLGCLPLSAMAVDPPTSSFTQSWGNFEGVRIGASITTGYTLQTVSGSNPIQETKLNLTVLADASIADKTYDYFYIDLQDAEGNTVRRVMWSGFTVEDKTPSSGTYEFTTAGSVYTQKREDDGTLTRDPSALQPTVSFDGKYAYINGVAYTVEGAGTLPVYAQVGYQVSSTAVTLPAQRIGTFNIASYSDDVMTKNLTFNLDATDAYYAYSTVAMVANEKYVLPTVTPIRDHYTFKGWKLNDTTYLPGAEIPYTLTSTDLMLTALWERDTVQFSAGHTDLPEGVKFLNDKVKVMLDGEEITNQIFVDPSNTNTLILPYGSEVYFTLGLSEYYDPATLEVVVGDYLLAPINVEQGDLVAGTDTTPADQLTNYTYMFKVTEDVSWTVRDVLAQRTFVVTMPVGHFNAELVSVNGTALGDTDSKVSASVIYSKGYTFTVEPMDGYEITGVYVNGAELTAVNDVYTVQDVKTAQNVEVLVKEIPNYTITYVVNNTQYATQVVAEGSQITNMPKSPDVTGYDFEGWYTQGLTGGEGDKILTTTTVNGDMIVYAKLTAKTYTISYDTNSNGEVTTSITASKKTYDQPVKLDATVLTRPGYTFLGHGREKDYGGERPMVAVREDVEILAYRCFWLSPTPDEPGSRFPVQSPCPRTCAVVKLRLPDGLIFRLYDTHLDHLCPEAREAGLKQLLAVMEADNRQEPLPMMLMGDFNADPGSAEMAPIRENTLGLRDLTAETGPTFHGYGNPEEFIKIDYIFATEPFVSAHTATRLWTQVTDKGTYLSDHYPVEADFELK